MSSSQISSNELEEYLTRLKAISEKQMEISKALNQLLILMQMPSESTLGVLQTVLVPIVGELQQTSQEMQNQLAHHQE